MFALPGFFLGRLVRQRGAGPDLAVRVRIGAPHDFALVLEDLDPAIGLPQVGGLFGPDPDDILNRLQVHFGKGQVVPGGKANHPTGACLGFGAKERVRRPRIRNVREQGREIVIKDKGARVVRVAKTTRPLVPRAEIAPGFVGRTLERRPVFPPGRATASSSDAAKPGSSHRSTGCIGGAGAQSDQMA